MLETRRVGDIEVVSLLDGVAGLEDSFEESFPEPAQAEWAPFHKNHPELVTPEGNWRLHVRCWLIRAGDRSILVDTGTGPVTSPTRSWWSGGAGRLPDELAAAGVGPADVDTIAITHVHDDHIGGTMSAPDDPAFPNARYLIHRADWDWVVHYADEDEEFREMFEALMKPIENAGLVELVSGTEVIAPAVRLRHLPGHTPGHQVIELASGEERLTITGDTFNHPALVANPDWTAGTDDDSDRAKASRREMLQDLADGRVFAPTHLAEPFGRATPGNNGRRIWRAETNSA